MEIAEYGEDNLKLHRALQSCVSDYDILEEIHKKNYEHTQDARGRTILHLASKCARAKVIHNLLKIGVDINETDDCGKTSLHYAVAANSIEVVLILISYGAEIDAADKCGQTPLFYACQYRREKIILLLLHYAADIEYRNSKDETVLLQMCAAKKGDFNEIIKLLIIMNANIFATNKYGQTAFDCAVQNNLDEIILLLSSIKVNSTDDNERLFDDIIKNLNLNFYTTNKWNETFLHIICSNYRKNNKKIMPWPLYSLHSMTAVLVRGLNDFDEKKDLLQNKYTVNNPVFRTYEIIKLLVKTCDIDVNAKNYLGETVLHLLCTKTIAAEEFSKCLQLLIENGGNINITENFKLPPLQYAIVQGNTKYVKIILANGGDVKYNCKPKTKCWSFYIDNKIAIFRYFVYIAVNSFNQTLLHIVTLVNYVFPADISILDIIFLFDENIQLRMLLEHHSIFTPELISKLLLKDIVKHCNLNLNYTDKTLRGLFSFYASWPRTKKLASATAFFIMSMKGDTDICQHLNNVCSLPEYGNSKIFKELQKLNNLKFNNTETTVLELLMANPNKLTTLVKNENILTQLSSAEFHENQAPLFGDHLREKLREALERKKLLVVAAAQIRTLIPEHSKLDELPLEIMCRMLNNDHLHMLIE